MSNIICENTDCRYWDDDKCKAKNICHDDLGQCLCFIDYKDTVQYKNKYYKYMRISKADKRRLGNLKAGDYKIAAYGKIKTINGLVVYYEANDLYTTDNIQCTEKTTGRLVSYKAISNIDNVAKAKELMKSFIPVEQLQEIEYVDGFYRLVGE